MWCLTEVSPYRPLNENKDFLLSELHSFKFDVFHDTNMGDLSLTEISI